MPERLDPAKLSDRDHVRIWTAVVCQALKDAQSSNGVSEEARQWLSDPAGAQRILEGLGWTPRRARAAAQHALQYPRQPDDDLL